MISLPADPEALLTGLDPEQREVATTLRGPVRVLAGAGTGKTRAITHRIAYGVACGVYAPTEILAVTFTTRAAGEMRTRVRALGAPGVQARTFHAAALRQLRYFWPRAHGTELPTLTESKLGIIAGATRRLGLRADQTLLKDLAAEIEWAKVSNVGPEDYADIAPTRGRAVTGHDAATVGRCFASYEETKRSQQRMDFEDVLLLTAGLLDSDDRVAAAVRRQYKWFVVDEFQDVSPLQYALLQLWLGGRDELCVVGDPMQTIYSFAGASSDYLADLPTRYPGTRSVSLVRNYRSTPEILAAANTLVPARADSGVSLQAQRGSGPAVGLTGYADEVAEAEQVAARIGDLRADGTPLSGIAILIRVHAQSEAFEAALAQRRIPYLVRGAARFYDRAEVREAVTRLRGAARGGEVSEDLVDDVRGVLAGMGWTPDPPESRGQARDRWESLQAVVDQAAEMAQRPPAEAAPTLGDFVEELDRRAADQHAPVAEGVTIATLHAAKGLEWETVFVCGVQEGTIPITYADSLLEIAEEGRLLYVGVTRARDRLEISWAQARNPGGRASRKPSRFLDRLLGPGDVTPAAPRRGRKAAHCRECGRPLATAREKKQSRCVDCPASYDEELYERLRAWRLARAGEDGVPAFVVFTDATLQLIAEARPTTAKALLRVSGVGRAKLERYGEAVLEIVGAE